MRNFKLLLLVIGVASLVGVSGVQAAVIKVQIDFNNQAGSYSGNQSPGHQTGLFSPTETTWNTVNGDATDLSYYSDGSLITGATGVHVDVGVARVDGGGANTLNEATGVVGWQYAASFYSVTTTGFYDTALMKDIIYSSNVQVAARVNGLAAGKYRVFSLNAFPGSLERTYNVSIGVNNQRPGDAMSTVTVGGDSVATSWVAAPGNPSNYTFTDVTISGPSDWITVIVRGDVSPEMNGLQIVSLPLPEPASAGVLLGAAGLLRRRRV